MYNVEILCVANSRKLGGRCVAGLRMDGRGWIRPVSQERDGELMLSQIRLRDGSHPRTLDVLSVPLLRPAPKPRQPENAVVAPVGWKLLQRPCEPSTATRLVRRALATDGLIFGNNSDRVSFPKPGETLGSSLTAVSPLELRWEITRSATGKRQVRTQFWFATTYYDLVLTDEVWETKLRHLPVGTFECSAAGLSDESHVVLVISLGEPFHGYCYKLVAGVLALDRSTRRERG